MTTRCLALALTCLVTALMSAQRPSEIRAGDVVLTGGWLIDGVRDDRVRNTGILVRAGKLFEVGADLSGRDPAPADVIRLGDDEHIVPGLFDLHAHYAVDLFGGGRVDEYTVNPVIFLANGVTSTFPGGEVDPEGMLAARRRIDADEQIGARIHSSGPYFGTARPGWRAERMAAERIHAEVDEWAARGARGFKAKGIRPDQLSALIDRAHRHGLTVTGHLDSGFRDSVNPRDAILMGIDRIEHFLGGDAISGDKPAYSSLERLDTDRPEIADIVRLYLSRKVYFDATLTAYGYFGRREPAVFEYWTDEKSFLTPHARESVEARPRRVNEQFERIYHVKRREIRKFFEMGGGGLITLGTDHPSWGEFLSGFSAHRELHAFVLAGIPPMAAIRIATINGARALGLSDRLGTIETGKLADLFVVGGNPLEDIRRTRGVRLVMRGGRVYESGKLLESVRGKLGPLSSADNDWWKGDVRFRTNGPG